MAYDNTNSGALFKNEKKTTDKHPDYNGSINVNGQDFWISAWLKTAESGRKFMSLAVTEKNAQKQDSPRKHDAAKSRELPKQGASGFDDMDDDIPFRDPMSNRAFCMVI